MIDCKQMEITKGRWDSIRIWIVLCVSILAIDGLVCQKAFAYRPFVSTDAAVAKKNEWEVELGVFNITHKDKENEIVVPSARINYGVIKDWEIVGESDLQIYKEGAARNTEIRDDAI